MADGVYTKTNKDLNAWLTDAKRFCDNFEMLPDDFPVHSDYLIDGITSYDWVAAYKQYQTIFHDMQEEIASHPAEYAIVKRDKTGEYKIVDRMIHQVLWLFVSLAQSGEIKNDILHVDAATYLEYIKGKAIGSRDATPKSIDCLFQILPKFGFSVRNFRFGENEDFTISAPNYPRLMTVIKASTMTQHCKKSLVSDYASFNYRIYSIAAKAPLPIEITHTYALMSDDCKAFASGLLDYLRANQWVQNGERHHWFDRGWLSYHKKNKWATIDGKPRHLGCRIEIYYQPNQFHLLVSGGDGAIDRAERMGALPAPYGEPWKEQMKCKGCRKGECKARRTVENHGEKTVLCAWHKIHLDSNPSNDLPVILDMLTQLTR